MCSSDVDGKNWIRAPKEKEVGAKWQKRKCASSFDMSSCL